MKYVRDVFGIFIITIIFFGVIHVELIFLQTYTPELDRVETGEWLSNFQISAFICLIAALVASLLWYALTQWVFKINNSRDAGKRLIWGLLSLLPIVAVIPGVFWTASAKTGLTLVYLFFLGDGVGTYWIATLLFSPSAFKYTPLGAQVFRRW